jgi:putative flippase GtrA
VDYNVTRKSIFKREANRFLRFAGVGVIGTFVQYLILTMLVQFGGFSAFIASDIGFVLGALINYYLNYHYTFYSSTKHHKEITKFFIVAFVGLFLNSSLMFLFTQSFHIHYLLAQIISTGLVLLWNFLGNRLWTFRAVENATRR